MPEKYEAILSDLSAILPGIGLILGCVFYYTYLYLTPVQEIRIEDYEPVFKTVEFVKIPENQEFLGKPPKTVQPTSYRVIYKDVPVLDENGKPVLKNKQTTHSGKGTAKIREAEIKEIVIPILKQPPWTYGDLESTPRSYDDPKPRPPLIQIPPKWIRIYQANIEYKHTGIYYTKKKVEFDVGITKESTAVLFATVASLISLALVTYRHIKGKRGS